MTTKNIITGFTLLFFAICFTQGAFAQDKVYGTDGKVLEGKVVEVGPTQLRMIMNVRPDGPVYVLNISQIDSVVYANGMKDELRGLIHKRDLLSNIPQLNTWTFDLLGFAFLSVSQSYERRLKNGLVGFRVPLYIGFIGGGIAGIGQFVPGQGVTNYSYLGYNGFSVATGLNPRFYLFKRRIVRAFTGPEVTIGYSATNLYQYYDGYPNSYSTYTAIRSGTFTALGKAGISLNPVDKFNISIDGGFGVGDMFGSPSSPGWTGVWHIGLALGTNF
jgi:hypothetical protein